MRALGLLILASCGAHDPGGPSAPPSAPPPAPTPGNLELGMPLSQYRLSDDGRYAIFTANSAPGARDATYAVVDTATYAMFVRQHVTQIDFAGDHRHVISVADGQLVVHDLATGALHSGPVPIAGRAESSERGKLAWAEQLGGEYRIHVRALATGAESVLTDLPVNTEWPLSIVFDERGHVVAWTARAIRAWDEDRPEPIVVVNEAINNEVRVAADGLTYVRRDGDQLVHIDLLPGKRRPVALASDHACGAGETDGYFRACKDDRYLVRVNDWFCIWDMQRARIQTRFRPTGDDFHCDGDLAWAREMPTGGLYTWYSTVTGRRVTRPKGRVDTGGPIIYGPNDDEFAGATEEPATQPAVIAQTAYGRAALVSRDGNLLWQSPAPSHATAMAFTSHNELVVVGQTGELWRVNLATRALRASQFPDCKLEDGDTIAIAPDGRAAVACVRGYQRALLREDSAAPLHLGHDFEGWAQTAATSAGAATFAWLRDDAQAWSIPDGTARWSFPMTGPMTGNRLAVTADGSRFAAGKPIAIHDAANKTLATVGGPAADGDPIAFSPSGAYLAIAAGDRLAIVEAASGGTVDELAAGAPLVAWDPSGKPRFAYWRAHPASLAIRDLAAHRDAETRAQLRPVEGPVRALAWSEGNRLAMLADHLVTLWEDSARPSTFAFAGRAGAELRADHRAVPLGDLGAARELLACVRGNLRYADATGCDSSLLPPPQSTPL